MDTTQQCIHTNHQLMAWRDIHYGRIVTNA
jgi:hypothetical protein